MSSQQDLCNPKGPHREGQESHAPEQDLTKARLRVLLSHMQRALLSHPSPGLTQGWPVGTFTATLSNPLTFLMSFLNAIFPKNLGGSQSWILSRHLFQTSEQQKPAQNLVCSTEGTFPSLVHLLTLPGARATFSPLTHLFTHV